MNTTALTIGVPIHTTLFLRLTDFLREKNDPRDPVLVVSDAIEYWLMNADFKSELLIDENNGVSRGYQWKKLFLPDGTQLRMSYKGKYFYAKVEGDEVVYDGNPVSPASMVNSISGTSRSSWRDMWFKRPKDKEWLPAREWSKEREKQITRSEKLLAELIETE
jgi:hypothetical protein